MNIFYVDKDPKQAAQDLVDSHVRKMILESAQLLSTAHRVLDGEQYIEVSEKGRKLKRWKLKEFDDIFYKSTHVNHPSATWVRKSIGNYLWLYEHFCSLLNEFTYRWGKHHKCEFLIEPLSNTPKSIPNKPFSPVTLAMPDSCKIYDDHIECYRYYYNTEKRHLFKWTNADAPKWITNLEDRALGAKRP